MMDAFNQVVEVFRTYLQGPRESADLFLFGDSLGRPTPEHWWVVGYDSMESQQGPSWARLLLNRRGYVRLIDPAGARIDERGLHVQVARGVEWEYPVAQDDQVRGRLYRRTYDAQDLRVTGCLRVQANWGWVRKEERDLGVGTEVPALSLYIAPDSFPYRQWYATEAARTAEVIQRHLPRFQAGDVSLWGGTRGRSLTSLARIEAVYAEGDCLTLKLSEAHGILRVWQPQGFSVDRLERNSQGQSIFALPFASRIRWDWGAPVRDDTYCPEGEFYRDCRKEAGDFRSFGNSDWDGAQMFRRDAPALRIA